MRRIMPFVSLFILIGCSTASEQPEGAGAKPDFTRDSAQCEREAQQTSGVPYGNPQLGRSNQVAAFRQMYQMCMESRGWTGMR
ncbi:MAG TPA: hypothetical protein VKH64_13320 [Candidatus Binatia bacterium]|nr:hypothetical protein [Candidatus Binatia bacterium]